jgi:hypothetical protein
MVMIIVVPVAAVVVVAHNAAGENQRGRENERSEYEDEYSFCD